MNVVFLSPAYPVEMQHYTRGLAKVGARVWGVGDQPLQALPSGVREALDDYLQVPRIMDEADVAERLQAWLRGRTVDRIEGIWEPLVIPAARLRERFGVPGMSLDTVMGFRDKQLMKERVAAAGLRVPYAFRCSDAAQVAAAAERVGFPLIIKPIDGAGSADTFRVRDAAELAEAMARTRHVPVVSCEEFIDGEEFTYDTICLKGRPVYENVAQYLPRPLIARQNEWISPIICTVRDLEQPALADGIALGRGVLQALGMGSGFTHMEWYKKSDGEVVFGEIGCRPGGAHLVDQMNFTSDIDLFQEWARAVCWHSFEAVQPRRYNTAIVFKRAVGQGRIQRITGLGEWMKRCEGWVCAEQLLRPGQQRRDWLQTLVSDGFVIVRHPEWGKALEMAGAAATDIRMFAG